MDPVNRVRFNQRGVAYDLRDGVGRVTLDRGRDQNRITYEMAAALTEVCEEAEDGDAVVVVVRGSGNCFCAGLADGVVPEALRGRGNPVEALARITKPVVAVLDGPATGAGAELALAADLRIAADGATLAFPDVSEGRLPRLPGKWENKISEASGLKCQPRVTIGLKRLWGHFIRWERRECTAIRDMVSLTRTAKFMMSTTCL